MENIPFRIHSFWATLEIISTVRNFMEVVSNIDKFFSHKNSAITIGTFDGIHLGHQAIIRKLCEISKVTKINSVLVTFDPHPQTIIKSKKKEEIRILTTIEEKKNLLQNFDLDFLFVIKFTKKFSKIDSSQFIEDFLVNKFKAKEIVIGYNHAFGRDRKGSFDILNNLSRRFNYNITLVEPVEYKGKLISSTRIRKTLKDGEVYDVSRMLGRNYSFSGKVIKGKGIREMINIPTANIKPYNNIKLIPKNGTYVAKILVREKMYSGLLNIGVRPTFDSKKQLSIEANIFNFNDNIYNEEMRVEVIERLRDEIKFENAEALIKQIQKDREECNRFFSKYVLKER